MKASLLILAIALTFQPASGQQDVSPFKLPDVVSGKMISLDQFSGKVVVVIFTSNDCPFDNYYRERIAALIGQYGNRATFLLINAHLDPQEAEAPMKQKASGWGFGVPYLSDKSQTAMDALGARRSPEVFLLKPANGTFTVYYSGAIDDNPQEASAVVGDYLRDALENLLAGKPAGPTVRAAGCSIRKN